MSESKSTDQYRIRLKSLLKKRALQRGFFTLSSGRTSSYYLDVKTVSLSADGAWLIATLMLNLLVDYPDVTVIGGPSLGADPIIGSMLSLLYSCHQQKWTGFLVRGQAKDHGTGRLIDGPLNPGSTVLLIDDVATTGGSLLWATEIVQTLDCDVAAVAVVIDRLEGASRAIEARGIPFRSLFTIHDLGVHPDE